MADQLAKDDKPEAKMPKKDKMKVPVILKVKDPVEDKRFADIHDHLPKMPCLGLIIGCLLYTSPRPRD